MKKILNYEKVDISNLIKKRVKQFSLKMWWKGVAEDGDCLVAEREFEQFILDLVDVAQKRIDQLVDVEEGKYFDAESNTWKEIEGA